MEKTYDHNSTDTILYLVIENIIMTVDIFSNETIFYSIEIRNRKQNDLVRQFFHSQSTHINKTIKSCF